MQTYSTEFSSGVVEFDSNWQRIFVTALTFRLDQAILTFKGKMFKSVRCLKASPILIGEVIILFFFICIDYGSVVQYSHREIPISPARLGDTFCCLGDFLSFHRDNRYSQRDAQVTQRDVVTVHRA